MKEKYLNKLNKELDIIAAKSNYRLAIEKMINGRFVNIYSPSSLPLPSIQLLKYMKFWVDEFDNMYKNRNKYPGVVWTSRNPDTGYWDARTLLRFDLDNNILNIYFCTILCYPYNYNTTPLEYGRVVDYNESMSHYENLRRWLISKWDSRLYEAHKNIVPDIYPDTADDIKRIYSVIDSEEDISDQSYEGKIH
jgi:hypothetical protein